MPRSNVVYCACLKLLTLKVRISARCADLQRRCVRTYDRPLYEGMTDQYMKVWQTIIWRYDRPLYEGMTDHYMKVWQTVLWRYGRPLYEGMTDHYMKVWQTIIWRYDRPLYEGMTDQYMKVWQTIIWRYDRPSYEGMTDHYMKVWQTIIWRYDRPLYEGMPNVRCMFLLSGKTFFVSGMWQFMKASAVSLWRWWWRSLLQSFSQLVSSRILGC